MRWQSSEIANVKKTYSKKVQNSYQKRSLIVRLCVFGIMVFSAPYASAQVTVDGTTETDVIIDDESGRVTVQIAPTFDSRISYNSYTDFNVSAAGLDLDNRLVNARTIVNEVSGSNASDIQGEIEVLGQRAHVILANRNGITVDGGGFLNTGGVVLSTGDVGFFQRQVAPGIFQVNTILETGEGAITIEGSGLIGAMDHLDLLSKELRISGAITNENDEDRSDVRLYAGSSFAEYDSAIVPTNTESVWGRVSPGEAEGRVEAAQPIVVDITRTGSLSASRVYVEVTDLGAGVRYAGDGLATRRDFTITTDGELIFDGADLTAATDVNLFGTAIASTGDLETERRTSISAAFGSANLNASEGDIDLIDTRITGFSGFEPAGIEGAVNLTAEAGRVTIASTDEAIRSDIITFSREDIDVADDIILNAATTIDISDTVISSAADLILDAEEISVSGNLARTVFVSEGGILVNARSGNIVNQGGLFQALGLGSDSRFVSSLTMLSSGDIINRSVDEDHLGVLFSDLDIHLSSDGVIENDTARMISNGAISLNAAEGIRAIISYADGFDSEGRNFMDVLAQELGQSRSEQSVDFGDLALNGQLSFISAGTDLTLTAPVFYNRGAELSANDGNLTVNASEVLLESVYSGAYNFSRSCFVFCSSSGSSSVRAVGGRLTATGDINIIGAQTLNLRGGDAIALGDINVEADQIVLEAAPLPTIVSRPGGLYNFWAGTTSFVIWQDRFGTLTAGGTLKIETGEEVELRGGQLIGENIVNPAGERVVRLPHYINPLEDDHAGILSGTGLVGGDGT